MKGILCTLLALTMMAMCLSTPVTADTKAAAKSLSYDELPARHRARYEAELASALANARSRTPGQLQLLARAKGEFNGYTGGRTMNDLSVSYTVSDSVVTVGETIYFSADIACAVPPMVYTVGGLVMDENFDRLGVLGKDNGESAEVGEEFYRAELEYTPLQPGYVNFVLIVTDDAGNQVAMTTNTVQVYDKDEPLFNTVGVDDSLGVILSLDDTGTSVGQIITAAATFSAKENPVEYSAEWKLIDKDGNVVHNTTAADQFTSDGGKYTKSFSYQPLQAGKVQFLLTATDRAGNKVRVNTPYIPVEDGFYFEAELDRSAVRAGESAAGTYRIYGHQCSSTNCYIGWASYDPLDTERALQTRSSIVVQRAGRDEFSPRLGELVEFYAGATCEHFPDAYPASDTLTLLYGLNVTLVPTADQVNSGSAIGVEYTLADGLEPYQQITISGYSRDTSSGQISRFLQETVTDAEGTVYGTPRQGDEIYFEATVVESDGFTSVWKSDAVSVVTVRTPGDANDNGTVNLRDALLVLKYGADSSVTLNASNADVNADGKVDSRDALLLLQLEANWSVGLQ